MFCPNCGRKNIDTNTECEYCYTRLRNTTSFSEEEKTNINILNSGEIKVSKNAGGCITNVLMFFMVGPWLLVGLVFLVVGIFCSLSEHNETKDYEKTVATLNGYTNCTYDEAGDELCNAIYEYRVNGIKYTVSPSLLSNRFKQTDTVYYNPNNPSVSVMYAGWNNLIITGSIFIIVIVVIFILKTIVMKKIKRKNDNKCI